MTSEQQLKDAVYATLESTGSLNAIRARIRADIYAALDTQQHNTSSSQQHHPPPQPSNTNLLINELLREYLQYNNLHHTLSTLLAETGQPVVAPFDRRFVMGELGIVDGGGGSGIGGGGSGGAAVPLLYGMVAAMRGEVKERREHEAGERVGASGKEEMASVRPTSVGSINALPQHPQRNSMGTEAEERNVRISDAVRPQQHQTLHRSQLSS